MIWVDYLPAAVGVVHLVTAIGYYKAGQPGIALAYFAYGLANAGMIWAAVDGRS